MNIYLVARTDRVDYDEFDSFVVIAKTEEEAKNIHPYYKEEEDAKEEAWYWKNSHSWVKKDDLYSLTITLIGKATKEYKVRKVICASFNAG
mgnify:CR=1 FL=1